MIFTDDQVLHLQKADNELKMVIHEENKSKEMRHLKQAQRLISGLVAGNRYKLSKGMDR